MANLKMILAQLMTKFDQRESEYFEVHKAWFVFQLKDNETGEIHIHESEYVSKNAQNLVVK